MRVWVTRASPGAERTAERLRAMGHTPILSPVMKVKPLPAVIDLTGVAALAFTSANGLEAFAGRTPDRSLPVFAVGESTGQAARDAGFADVRSAQSDVVSLGRLIASSGLPQGAVVLSPGGRERAGDLQAESGPGVEVRTLALYETVAIAPAEGLAALEVDGVDAVLVHSPSAARRIAALCDRWRKGRAWFLALSPAVAQPLLEAGFEKVRAAPFPDEAALLKLLSETSSEPRMTDAPAAAETQGPPEPYAPPGPSARRRPAGAFALMALLALGLLAAAALVVYAPRLFPTRPEAAAASDSSPDTEAALRARIAELEQQLAARRPAMPAAGASSGLGVDAAQALSARIDRLEAAQARSARAASAAVAAAALADAAATSRPFAAELDNLERLAPGAAVAGLRPLAATGASTRAALAAEFPEVAARAASASRVAAADSSLVARATAALGALFTLRRIDDLSGQTPDAVLARAERRVADGDLEGALQQLAALPPGGQAATADWRERARRRVEVERRIAALRSAALRDLSAEGALP